MNKYLIYAITGAAAALVTGTVLMLLHFPIVISLSWALAAGIISSLTAHIVVNCLRSEMTPVKWQITIYGFGIAGGWIGAILSSTWGFFSFAVALIAASGMMMLGTFILMKKDEIRQDLTEDVLEDVPAFVEKTSDIADRLIHELRYEFVDDVIDGPLNHDRPLCLVDGNPLTVAEAIEKGLDDEADKGMAYIEKLMED